MIIQKINTNIDSSEELAFKYFSILSVINNIGLVKRDCQLLAFAVSQNKDISDVKEEFVKKYNTSLATVGNIISKLYRLKILEKHKRNIKINPIFNSINFNTELVLALTFKHGDKG